MSQTFLNVDVPFEVWQGNRSGGPWRAGDPRGVRLLRLESELKQQQQTMALAAWRVPVAHPSEHIGVLYATRGSGGRRNWAVWPGDFDNSAHYKEVALKVAEVLVNAEGGRSGKDDGESPRIMLESLMRNYGFSDIVQEALEGVHGWRRTYHNPCQLWVSANEDLFHGAWERGGADGVQPPLSIDNLLTHDAGLVDRAWEHRSDKSIDYVTRQIESAPSVCVRDAQGIPVAWAITHSDGAIGAMFVTEPWRRQGLGSVLVRALARKHVESHGGVPPFCYIQTHNHPSQKLFRSLQFRPVLDTTWDGYEPAVASS